MDASWLQYLLYSGGSQNEETMDRLRQTTVFRDFFPTPAEDAPVDTPWGGDDDLDACVNAMMDHFNEEPGQARLVDPSEDVELPSLLEYFNIDTTGGSCTLYGVRNVYMDNRNTLKVAAAVIASGVFILGSAGLVFVPWTAVKTFALTGCLGVAAIASSLRHIVAIATACLGGAAFYAWLARQYQRLNVREQEVLDVRNKFRNAFHEAPKKWVTRKCSHELAGDERSKVRKMLVDHVGKTHGRVFVYDGSSSDRSLHESKPYLYDYSRHIYTDKDAHMPRHVSSPTPDAGVVLIDSDFHRDDLVNVLLRNTCYFYTMTPSVAAGPIGNAALSIGPTPKNGYDPDSVTVVVNGGAEYTHKVWDFSCDNFCVHDLFGRTVFLCEHQRVSENKSIVMTLAVAWVPRFHWGLDSTTENMLYITKSAGELQRCKYNTDGVVHVSTIDDKGVEMISIALENTTDSVTIPYTYYRSAHSVYRSQKVKDNGFSSMLAPVLTQNTEFQAKARLVRDIMNRLGDNILPSMAHNYAPPAHTPIMQRPGFLTEEVPAEDAARAIQIACDKNDHEDTKRTGRSVFPAIVPGAVVLDDTRMSRENSIKKKVIEVRAKNLVSDERAAYWDHVTDQFCDAALSRFKHTLSPLSGEEVNELMDKPSQRAAYERLRDWSTEEINKIGGSSFIKKEPAASAAKCSRAITTAGDQYRHEFSRYTIPIAEVLKTLPFYVPGKTPVQTAERVHDRAIVAMHMGLRLFCADSSAHDGHRSRLTYRILARLYLYLYTAEQAQRLTTMLRSQSDRKVRMTARTYKDMIDTIVYWIETTYGSGYPDTSLSVTISLLIPAFATLLDGGIEIFHNWNAPPLIRHVTPTECLDFIVAHGGDDTCDMGMNPEKFERNCEDFDYKITPESYTTPTEPLTLLARTYPCPAITAGSYSDIRRVLTKIGITCTGEEITREEVYARKGLALLTTDPGTPVLSQLGRCLIRSAGKYAAARVHQQMRAGKLNDELSYQARQCVYTDTGYPQCNIETPGLVDDFVARLGGSPTIIDELCTTLDACNDISTYVPPTIPGNDWIAPVFTILGGAIVLPGQGIKGGVPVLEERESAGYTVYEKSWSRKPQPILIPDTHVILKLSGRDKIVEIPKELYGNLKACKTLPTYDSLPRVEYEPDAKTKAKHLGQLKLFLSFLEFDRRAPMAGGRLLILGSNPGVYLPLLKKLVGLDRIHTYDIKRQTPRGSDRHVHSSRGTVTLNNIEAIATEHWGWHVYCDIRTARGHDPTEQEVRADNALSRRIAELFDTSALMLKFRCTYDDESDDIIRPREILLQPFAPAHSTETRLYYDAMERRGAVTRVDKKEYEERLCAFNRLVRPFSIEGKTWETAYALQLMTGYGVNSDVIQTLTATGQFPSDRPVSEDGGSEAVPGPTTATTAVVSGPPDTSRSTVGTENRSPSRGPASQVSAPAPTRPGRARTEFRWMPLGRDASFPRQPDRGARPQR